MSAITTWWSYLYNSLTGAGGRPKGLQTSIPLAYSAESASAVTIDSAFQLSAVFACCRLITESIAGMPVYVYDVDENGVKKINTTHPVAKLFASGRINKWQTRGEFMDTMTMQQVMQGNCYALKQYNSQKQIIGLMPFMTQDMQVALSETGEIMYRYQANTSEYKDYSADQVLHVKCMGNGIVGLSPLGYARNSIGIGQAADNAVSRIYSNGAKPSGALMIDKILTDAQRAQLKSKFADLESGTQDRLFILEAGMKYQQISMSPQDIELLATRRFQIEDIARFFGVPSVLINDTYSSTAWGSGIQKITEGFYKLNLRPYLRRYQEAFQVGLLTPAERTRMCIEFDFQDFLQPDQSERIKTYGEAVSKGIMAPNEARIIEGWGKLPGGDQAFMQQQMVPIGMLGQIQQQKADTEQKSAENGGPKPSVVTVNMPEISIKTPDVNFKSGDITIPSTVNLPQTTVNVAPPEIKIEPPVVNVAAPTVNVAAPDVKFAAPDVKVDVAAPAVTVTPTIAVKLPKRKTKTSVKYDAQDRISESTQIEEDI